MKKKTVLKFTKYISIIFALAIIAFGVFYLGDKVLGTDNTKNFEDQLKDFFTRDDETGNSNVDSKPLSVEVDTSERTIIEGTMTVLVQSSKEITVEQENRIELSLIEEEDSTKYYAAKVKNIGLGASNVKMTFQTTEGESEDVVIPVMREAYGLPFGLNEVEPWEGSSYVVDGNSLDAPVGKTFRLFAEYEPSDLVDINKDYLLYTNAEGIMLREEAAESLATMVSVLKNETGKNVVIASGYRSYNTQVRTYTNWLKLSGQEEADKVSARPGYSEHQLGTSVDFMSEDSGFDFVKEFDQTVAGKWLKENSYEYGFIQTYPEGKEAITGYSYEAWHYRYVGRDLAKEVHDSGLTLTEYLKR